MRNYVQWNSILHFHGIPLCISAEFYFVYPQNSIPYFQGILHFHRIPWWRILICSSAIFWRIFLWKFAGLAEQNFRSSNYETKQELQSQLIHDFHGNTSGDVGILKVAIFLGHLSYYKGTNYCLFLHAHLGGSSLTINQWS